MGKSKNNVGNVHSIVNNLRYVKSETFRADHMKFALRRMKEMVGMSEQAMIMKMLWFAYEHDAFFDGYRERINTEWTDVK